MNPAFPARSKTGLYQVFNRLNNEFLGEVEGNCQAAALFAACDKWTNVELFRVVFIRRQS